MVLFVPIDLTITTTPFLLMTPSVELSTHLPPWVTDAASVASIIGLLLTLYVTYTIFQIRRRYARKGRIPEIEKKILERASELNKFLNNQTGSTAKNYHDACLLIQSLKPHVNDAIAHSTGETKKCAKGLAKFLDQVLRKAGKSTEVQIDDLWKCYRDAHEVSSYLSSTLLNDAWS